MFSKKQSIFFTVTNGIVGGYPDGVQKDAEGNRMIYYIHLE
jgi:hypothetical protein